MNSLQQVADQLEALCKADRFPLAKEASNHPKLQQLNHVEAIKNHKFEDSDSSTKILGIWIHSSTCSTTGINGFSDASQLAMAAAVFIKAHTPAHGVRVTLLCSKTKVAPLKRLTMPSSSTLSSKLHCGSKLRYSISKNGSSVISLKRTDPPVSKGNDKRSDQPAKVLCSRAQPSTRTTEGEEDFKLPTIEESDFEFSGTKLGQGAFGCVKLAIWNGTEVAVKCLNTNDNIKYLIREIKAMDLVRHPNIISIMSVCFTDSYVYILMEYFKSTTLTTYIANISTTLDYSIKKNRNYFISLQICKAISYMHGLNPSIFHKDLKPDNILINQELVVKICNLGLSKVSDLPSALNTTIGHHFHGTPMYMSPEILINNQPGTTHSDVWSMACCILELFSERQVWEVMPRFTIANLRRTVLKLKKPTSLEDVPITIRSDLSACFEYEPLKRPSALIMLQSLKLCYKESPENND
ncbi:uncharacterized protein LOC130673865 [Microplitis mediator]|uniref:uncharacterized protein LOC130673865 n=1 Tax=Microplitis mediator TaxID=375433 RepID=UPI0025533D22|nr:uncharacterized protein LOC130673865 [Microplitis mediator]